MTTMTFGGLRPTSTHRADKLGFSPFALAGRARDAWRLWAAERAMESLDDHVLHDIGVARAEIRYAVRTGERS